jgi:hypothetical protein
VITFEFLKPSTDNFAVNAFKEPPDGSGLKINPDRAVADFDRIDGERIDVRVVARTGLDVERIAVDGTGEPPVAENAVDQRALLVRAAPIGGDPFAVAGVEESDRLPVHFKLTRTTGRNILYSRNRDKFIIGCGLFIHGISFGLRVGFPRIFIVGAELGEAGFELAELLFGGVQNRISDCFESDAFNEVRTAFAVTGVAAVIFVEAVGDADDLFVGFNLR